jgi:hypothetical protein
VTNIYQNFFHLEEVSLMSKAIQWMCVAVVLAIGLSAVSNVEADACDKTAKPVPAASVVLSHPVPAPDVICPPVPPCCEDARICIIEDSPPVCYTETGLRAFVTIFRGAAARGVENATIRALNATESVPDCIRYEDSQK